MKKQITLILLTISVQFAALAGSFTVYHTVTCGETLMLGAVGYPTWNEAIIIQAPANGVAGIIQGITSADSLVYLAATGYMGTDTFVVACAHATQITCDTGIYIIETTCANAAVEQNAPVAIKVFPNPATNEVLIETSLPFTAAKLCSNMGHAMLVRRWPQGVYHAMLPVDGLPMGTYWLEIRQLEGVVVRKVLIGR